MWGDLDPQWRLLQSQLETKDLAGTHLPSSRNDFSQISPSGQTKEALRTDGNTIAWQAWDTARPVAIWLKPFWLKPFGSSLGSRTWYLTSTKVDSKGKVQVRLRVGWSSL